MLASWASSLRSRRHLAIGKVFGGLAAQKLWTRQPTLASPASLPLPAMSTAFSTMLRASGASTSATSLRSGASPRDLVDLLRQHAKRPNTPEATSALAAVAPDVSSCTAIFSARDVAQMLHSIGGFGAGIPGMTVLLEAMPRHISACRDVFSARDVAMSLYGLRGCSSERPEVLPVLKALAPQIARCRETLSAQGVGNALYGLKGCSSEHPEVLAVLRVLAPQIARCRETLSAQGVGNALLGLKGCSSEHPEVLAVLRALAPQIERCKELDAQGVGNALYGLQGCSSEHPEVLAVLKALAPHIAHCREALSAQGVGSALYGLQSCSSEHPEVLAVLRALAPQIARCRETLSAQGVGNAFFGLQSCSSEHASVAAVFEALALSVDLLTLGLPRPSNAISTASPWDLRSVAQGCAALLLRPTDGRTVSPPVVLADKLTQLYDACVRELDSRTVEDTSSKSEARLRARTTALFSDSARVSVRPDACYLHGFEADIVLTVLPHPDSGLTAPVTVNV